MDAPTGRGAMAAGRVDEQYGKLARVTFAEGNDAWVLATNLEPPAEPLPVPEDTCNARVNDRVRAPFARLRKVYAGRVWSYMGVFAHVRFDDGDETWADCEAIRAYERRGE